MQLKHHGAIVKALLHLMGPEQEPRVQAHASSAIVNFCENLDGNIMGLYLEQLLQRFQGLLGSNNQLVMEGGLTALSSVTDSSGVRIDLFALPHWHHACARCGTTLGREMHVPEVHARWLRVPARWLRVPLPPFLHQRCIYPGTAPNSL